MPAIFCLFAGMARSYIIYKSTPSAHQSFVSISYDTIDIHLA